MSVNIFKNGILSKIAGAVGDAVPLINNFLTNQEGKGAADANTVYVLNNKIEEVNSSLTDLGGFKPVIDESTGEITGYKTTIGGADTVFPFKSGSNEFELVYSKSESSSKPLSYTYTVPKGITHVLIHPTATYSDISITESYYLKIDGIIGYNSDFYFYLVEEGDQLSVSIGTTSTKTTHEIKIYAA